MMILYHMSDSLKVGTEDRVTVLLSSSAPAPAQTRTYGHNSQ